MRPFEVSLWKAASYAISTRLSFLTIRVLRGDVAQHLPTHGIDLAIGPEKSHGGAVPVETAGSWRVLPPRDWMQHAAQRTQDWQQIPGRLMDR
jgi:hypothetical protein